MRLGDILVRKGLASQEQVAAALGGLKEGARAHDLGQALLDGGAISETALLEALAEDFGCEVLAAVDDDLLDPALVEELPVEWARSNSVLPVRWKGGIGALTCDPSAVAPLDDLALLLGQEIVPVLAPREGIARAIEKCYYRREDKAEDVLKGIRESGPAPAGAVRTSDDLLRVPDQAPVTQLVNVILLEAVKARASDVHIEPFENALKVRYRIDGMLYEQASPPKHLEAALVSRVKVMARLDIAEKRLPQDGNARVRVGEREIDIRVSTVPVAEGERVVLRLLNRESTLLPLTDLGMPDDVLAGFRRAIAEPNGVILVTGPTGSGKTTTLYAALREIDTAHLNVLTIEDPIEYQLPSVGQMQVKPKIGLTFAQGLRHILRQDPDVVLVGETRDLETAEIVVRASLTGHLVFSTLHTNDATSAVVRMVDMGIEPYLLSSAIRACLAQRLVRLLCPKCRKEYAPAESEIQVFGPAAQRLRGRRLKAAAGCPDCLGGYRGRTGIYELMTVSPKLQEAIRSRISAQELRRMAVAGGMRTLLDDAAERLVRGDTGIPEVLRAVGRAEADTPS